MICPSCGTENEPGRKFCGECATRLVSSCPACGTANPPTARFCGECGTSMGLAAANQPATPVITPAPNQPTASGPIAERRLVASSSPTSSASPPWPRAAIAEETRELLSRYFDLPRDVVGRYGGTVEKFIGDAVMAVWGAPTAHEDDAERAVRAALELVDAVKGLGPDIQARAGVLTGEAAVTLGATNQGMVAGDLVNTASRLQSVATPGTVLVGEATQRAASRAIAFEEAGEQTLKGKASPVPAWRAVRVVAERRRPQPGRDARGAVRRPRRRAPPAQGPVPRDGPRAARPARVGHRPGRDRQDPARPGSSSSTSTGSSRRVWWHDGRSPGLRRGDQLLGAGRDGPRAGPSLLETDDEPTTRAKVARRSPSTSPIPTSGAGSSRPFSPCSASSLGRAARSSCSPPGARSSSASRRALRSCWSSRTSTTPTRACSTSSTTCSSGAANVPIYVVTLARPELIEKPARAGARASATSPRSTSSRCPSRRCASCWPGSCRVCPSRPCAAIVDRADGIPLYAVETVRMLLAEGRLALDEGCLPADRRPHRAWRCRRR